MTTLKRTAKSTSHTFSGSKFEKLSKLKKKIQLIKNCDLKKNATNLVFGDGNINAKVMIIGEGPGAQEDAVGRPFVGRAGKLLDKMLTSIQLNRTKVYISNVVNYRPPANRRPTEAEIERYLPYLKSHIEIISPKILVLLGKTALNALLGNDIVATISDGTAPFGMIDDVRSQAFTKAKVDEIVLVSVSATETNSGGQLVNSEAVTGVLENPHITESSFTSTVSVILNYVNGIITIPAGTVLNYDSNEDGTYDGFKIITNYIYRVSGKPGDDTTLGSGRITIHYQRGIYATDQFDTTQIYPLNATLYAGLDGKLTSKQPTTKHPGVAICTGPPSASMGTLEFMLL